VKWLADPCETRKKRLFSKCAVVSVLQLQDDVYINAYTHRLIHVNRIAILFLDLCPHQPELALNVHLSQSRNKSVTKRSWIMGYRPTPIDYVVTFT